MGKDVIYDVAVIGGGINGSGIAADASNRGLRVLLCEQNDLASGTSSASTKLIHGGLRYLELYEFKLVREGLAEREALLKNAKHLVKPLNFILPLKSNLRSRFMIRLGLFLYDHLAFHSLSNSTAINLKNHAAGKYLKPEFKYAFQYTDGFADDSRLVISNALSVKEKGGDVFTYTECVNASRDDDYWILNLKDKLGEKTIEKKARVLINATGPWVGEFLNKRVEIKSQHEMSLVKGSHIVVKKQYEEDFAYILQNDDKRIVFVIPYLSNFTLIGTTDIPYTEVPGKIEISEVEVEYLLRVFNDYFETPLNKKDIIHTYAGIRPLLKSPANKPSEITRDYVIEIDKSNAALPLISIFGGKLTTYRRLAEKVIDKIAFLFPSLPRSKTSSTSLPGSNYPDELRFKLKMKQAYSWLNNDLLMRYLRQYGTNIQFLLAGCRSLKDLGQDFGANLYAQEVDYLFLNEWAKTADDILWRRTKLGYFFPRDKILELENYLKLKSKNK